MLTVYLYIGGLLNMTLYPSSDSLVITSSSSLKRDLYG